jgi:hypothetical protein
MRNVTEIILERLTEKYPKKIFRAIPEVQEPDYEPWVSIAIDGKRSQFGYAPKTFEATGMSTEQFAAHFVNNMIHVMEAGEVYDQ